MGISTWKRKVAALTAALLVISTMTIAGPQAHAAPWAGTIDTTDMAAVRDAYQNVFLPTQESRLAWTGNTETCDAGSPGPGVNDDIVTAINFMRAMAGLSPVVENKTISATYTQQAALMAAAQNHWGSVFEEGPYFSNRTPDLPCYTPEGAQRSPFGSGRELYGGYGDARNVMSYMWENIGSIPARGTILGSHVTEIGLGAAVGGRGVLHTNSATPAVPAPSWYSWPSAGYFPFEAIGANAAWTFYSKNPISNSTSMAVVDMTVTKNGEPMVGILPRVATNAAGDDDAIMWYMFDLDRPAPGAVDTYRVTINGRWSLTYDVMIFDASVGDVTFDAVSITGTPQVGETLTASATGVDPADARETLSWHRDGSRVVLTYGDTYTPTAADVGSTLTVTATGTRTGYRPGTLSSAPTAVVTLPPVRPGAPVITGEVAVGNTLRADPGTWSPEGVELDFQWYADGVPILGANALVYAPNQDDVDQWITFGVVGTLEGHTQGSVVSQAVGPVQGLQPPGGPEGQQGGPGDQQGDQQPGATAKTGGMVPGAGQGPLVAGLILVLSGVVLVGLRRRVTSPGVALRVARPR